MCIVFWVFEVNSILVLYRDSCSFFTNVIHDNVIDVNFLLSLKLRHIGLTHRLFFKYQASVAKTYDLFSKYLASETLPLPQLRIGNMFLESQRRALFTDYLSNLVLPCLDGLLLEFSERW